MQRSMSLKLLLCVVASALLFPFTASGQQAGTTPLSGMKLPCVITRATWLLDLDGAMFLDLQDKSGVVLRVWYSGPAAGRLGICKPDGKDYLRFKPGSKAEHLLLAIILGAYNS